MKTEIKFDRPFKLGDYLCFVIGGLPVLVFLSVWMYFWGVIHPKKMFGGEK